MDHPLMPLLLQGAKANMVDTEGKSLLYVAASMEYSDDYTKLLRNFLENGALVEPLDSSQPKPFIAVLEKGDLEAVELMMDHGIELKNYVNDFPLHKASRNPRLEVLEFLLYAETFDPNQANELGQTALIDAVRASNPEAVETLLNWGLQPNSADKEGCISLHHVDYHNGTKVMTKCIEILLEHGANGDAENSKGVTPLHLSVGSKYSSEYAGRLELFLKHGAGQKDDETVYEILRYIIQCGDLDALQLYIKQRSIDLSKHKDDWLLWDAVPNPRGATLEFLLNTGLFDLSRKDSNGMNILYAAVMAYNPETLGVLLDWGVEVDAVGGGSLTPMHLLARRATLTRTEGASDKCMDLMLFHGAEFNSKRYKGETAFEIAMPMDMSWWNRLPELPAGAMPLLAHATLLESQGKHLESQNFHQRGVEYKQCLDELKSLKAEFLGDSVTLYDILADGKSRFYPEKPGLMRKLHDCEYVRSLESKFPIYGRRLARVVEYVNLKEVAAERLSRLLELERENFYLIIEKIVKMLPIRDLRVLKSL